MRILILTHNPHKQANPYISTLVNAIEELDNHVKFGWGYRHFWTNKVLDFDIIHCMWPEIMLRKHHTTAKVAQRLTWIKQQGIKIVCTCHNLYPHINRQGDRTSIYEAFYKASNLIIHLGQYSHDMLKQKFRHVAHIIIPHHVYNTIYHPSINKQPNEVTRILCAGAFRTAAEQQLVIQLAKALNDDNIQIIAPTFYRRLLDFWRAKYRRSLPKNLKAGYKFITHQQLQHNYELADVALIQRNSILNSGNVPMAMLFGLTIVGPNCGNVGQWLQDTNNLTFDPLKPENLPLIIKQAIEKQHQGQGQRNKAYAQAHLSTEKIAEKLLKEYRCLMN